jgi:hypothetical protein
MIKDLIISIFAFVIVLFLQVWYFVALGVDPTSTMGHLLGTYSGLASLVVAACVFEVISED